MKKSVMIYKHKISGERIQVTKSDSTTYVYSDPKTGEKIITTKHMIQNEGYRFNAKESKAHMKRFDSLKRTGYRIGSLKQ